MSKYGPLEEFLNGLPTDTREITLSFAEIEKCISANLPESASNHREWWSNQSDTSNRPQARSWTVAGFLVDSVHQSAPKWVRFRRKP